MISDARWVRNQPQDSVRFEDSSGATVDRAFVTVYRTFAMADRTVATVNPTRATVHRANAAVAARLLVDPLLCSVLERGQ